MKENSDLDLAAALFQEAYERQMEGRLEEAIDLYHQSIRAYPTAEAYTFLGWTYSFQGRLDEAIEECKRAIEIDPEFGNPYNDIGVYLIEKGDLDDAIPWLEQAVRSSRYDSYHYPHYNLGRIYAEKGMLRKALEEYEASLRAAPDYSLAINAIESIRRKLN